jgi:hypothetical protein
MQLPRSGKRCAEPATAATAKAEMEVFGGGDGAPHKRVKPLPPPPQAFRSVIGLFFSLLAWLCFCSVYDGAR